MEWNIEPKINLLFLRGRPEDIHKKTTSRWRRLNTQEERHLINEVYDKVGKAKSKLLC